MLPINLLSLLAAVTALFQVAMHSNVVDLRDGYSRVRTPSYEIEVPTGWKVTDETPWGQRKAYPKDGQGDLGVMTAPPGRQTWDQLYQTSLFYIQREAGGKPTPYRLGKTAGGLETASFEVLDASGFAARRYVLIRGTDGRLLALSVRVPDQKADREWSRHFERMCRTARFLPESSR